ncbi:hypothetical protein EIP86_002426 [Pleurotus ostreatoroseus]|nr:hypothetical protein EIP86_002426 [Pleurotus ostreatoroseus]
MDSSSIVSSTGLSKLTVPQLKAICKDRKLTGYSKLAKNALLEKLAEAGVVSPLPQPGTLTSTPSNSAPAASIVCAKNDNGIRSRAEPNGRVGLTSQDPGQATGSNSQASECGLRNASQPQTMSQTREDVTETALGSPLLTSTEPRSSAVDGILRSRQALARTMTNSRPEHKSNNVLEASSKTPGELSICARHKLEPLETIPPPNQALSSELEQRKPRKRPAEITTENTPAKQRKTTQPVPVPKNIVVTKPSPSIRTPRSQNQLQQAQHSYSQLVSCQSTLSQIPPSVSVIPNTVLKPSPGSGKRFKPLVINKKLASSLAVKPNPPQVSIRSFSGPAALVYLDLSSTSPTPSLDFIALPPSISQRKRVDQWAIILSDLDDASRRQCAFTSKLFRYAGVFTVLRPVLLLSVLAQ